MLGAIYFRPRQGVPLVAVLYTVTWYFLCRFHFLTPDLIRSADIAHLRLEKIIMYSLFDQSNVVSLAEQEKKKKKKKKENEKQQTHKGHAYNPQKMFTLKKEAKCCNCSSFVDKPTVVFRHNMCVKWNPLYLGLPPHTHTHFYS